MTSVVFDSRNVKPKARRFARGLAPRDDAPFQPSAADRSWAAENLSEPDWDRLAGEARGYETLAAGVWA